MNGQRGPKIQTTVYVPIRANEDGVLTRASLALARWPHGGNVTVGLLRASSWSAGFPELLARLLRDACIDRVDLQVGHRLDAAGLSAALDAAQAADANVTTPAQFRPVR